MQLSFLILRAAQPLRLSRIVLPRRAFLEQGRGLANGSAKYRRDARHARG